MLKNNGTITLSVAQGKPNFAVVITNKTGTKQKLMNFTEANNEYATT